MNQVTSHAETIKQFLLTEFLPDEDPSELTETTELVAGGILDSLATLKLVAFLEEEFSISIEPHEANKDDLNSIETICELVASKL